MTAIRVLTDTVGARIFVLSVSCDRIIPKGGGP